MRFQGDDLRFHAAQIITCKLEAGFQLLRGRRNLPRNDGIISISQVVGFFDQIHEFVHRFVMRQVFIDTFGFVIDVLE